MNKLLATLCCLQIPALVHAQDGAWKPSPRHTQISLWPADTLNSNALRDREQSGTVVDSTGARRLVGGRPRRYVANVSNPTITPYFPASKNTGAAVVVFPGGGYNVPAIDIEGTEVCDWLTAKGITCVLLKYRVPCDKKGPYLNCATALQDAQRSAALVRSLAAQWHVDPRKIGVLGFSAGGHMVAAISTRFD